MPVLLGVAGLESDIGNVAHELVVEFHARRKHIGGAIGLERIHVGHEDRLFAVIDLDRAEIGQVFRRQRRDLLRCRSVAKRDGPLRLLGEALEGPVVLDQRCRVLVDRVGHHDQLVAEDAPCGSAQVTAFEV